MGRPKLPDKKKKEQITITVSREVRAHAMECGNASEFFESAAKLKIRKDAQSAKREKGPT